MRFCRENQKISNKWSIDPQTAQIRDNIFTGNLLLDGTPNDLAISIYLLKTGGIRFRISPTKNETFNRFDLSQNKYVINQDTINSVSPINSNSNDRYFQILFPDYHGISLIIEYSTLKITVKQNDKIVTIVNGRNQLVFEHHTNKEVPPEIYNGFTDNIKNGETAVGCEFFFPGDIKFTGLSERASPINLADTDNSENTEESNDDESSEDVPDENEPLRLFNTDSFEYEADSPINLYSSIPFCHAHSKTISSALFWINSCDTFVNIIHTAQDGISGRELKFVSEVGYVDFILFYGAKSGSTGFKQIMKQYCEVTGYPSLAPLFAFGYHQSRWGYSTQHEVGVVIRSLDDIGVPFDCLWLDVDHLSKKTPFTFSKQGFPNPMKLIDTLGTDDRYVVKLSDPHFPRTSDYRQFKESHRQNFLVVNGLDDSSPFVGDSWPGSCVFPDFLNPAAFRWYSQQFSYESERDGAAPNVFYWNDMNEPSIFKSDESTFPKATAHFGGYEDREVHNINGLLNSASTYEGLLWRNPDRSKRPFVLSRSFFAGSQKFAWTWTGDNAASWEHMSVSLPMVLASGCCGMPFTGADVGGFLKSPDGTLLTRWFQLGAWLYPFCREHCHHKSARREPFMYDDEEQENIRKAVLTRYRILPVWYTASRNANLTGVPPVLPLWALFGDARDDLQDVDNAAVLAESLYIAPVLEDDADDIEVVKPPGTWYRFGSGRTLNSPSEIVKVSMDETPVFLRAGKIIPTFVDAQKSALKTLSSSCLALYVALDENGNAEGEIYLDDGESYNCLIGEFVHRIFLCKNGVLNSLPGDENQNKVPQIVKNLSVNKIIVYGAQHGIDQSVGEASFDDGVLAIQNLNFNINEDWSLKIQ